MRHKFTLRKGGEYFYSLSIKMVIPHFSSEQYPGFGASYLQVSGKELNLARNAKDLSEFMVKLD